MYLAVSPGKGNHPFLECVHRDALARKLAQVVEKGIFHRRRERLAKIFDV